MTETQAALRSRIVGEGYEAPDQLLANPSNWRIHPKAQQVALEAMLKTVGWVQRIIVNKRTGHIVDGHLRVEVAMRRSEAKVPVLYVDLSEAEEKVVLAAIDPIGGMAATDQDILNDLLQGLETGNAELDAFLAGLSTPEQGETNPDDEWDGMPEYEQPDANSFRHVVVHFRNNDDVDEFFRLIGQSHTDKTKSVWHPKLEEMDTEAKRYAEAECDSTTRSSRSTSRAKAGTST